MSVYKSHDDQQLYKRQLQRHPKISYISQVD